MPSADDSESSDAHVVIADETLAADDLLVPVGTVLASANRPPADLTPSLQWVEFHDQWWYRSNDNEDLTLFREPSAPVPGPACGKGVQKGKRKRGTSPRYQ